MQGKCTRDPCGFKHMSVDDFVKSTKVKKTDTSKASAGGKRICHQFRDNGSCNYGAKCRFSHESAEGQMAETGQDTAVPGDDEDDWEDYQSLPPPPPCLPMPPPPPRGRRWGRVAGFAVKLARMMWTTPYARKTHEHGGLRIGEAGNPGPTPGPTPGLEGKT